MTDPVQIQIQNADPQKISPKDMYQHIEKDLPRILKLNRQGAVIKKSQYDAFIEAGFTDEQALYLIS